MLRIGDREVKWTFRAMKMFEYRSRELLRQQGISVEQIVDGRKTSTLAYTMPLHTGSILAAFGRMSEIMEAAVSAATGLSMKEGRGEDSEASKAIDEYLDAGGSLEELQQGIYEAYLEQNDPSSIPLWRENLSRAAKMAEIERELGRAAVREAEEKLQSHFGMKSTGSAKSN